MKNWYLLAAVFGGKVQALTLVRATSTGKAVEDRPYGWKDFTEPSGPGQIKVWEVETLDRTGEIFIHAVAATTADS